MNQTLSLVTRSRYFQQIRAILRSKKTFTYWIGFGVPPFLFGMAIVGFFHSLPVGLFNTALVSAFITYTIDTTCCRCPYYGTSNCPVPGRVVPRLLPKLKDTTVSLRGIRVHYAVDLAMIAYANWTYFFLFRPLFPIVLVGSVGALLIVYLPKRHHGLLYRLPKTPR